MRIQKCFCGWMGPSDNLAGCPACQRPFTNYKCEGCGE